MKTKNPILDPDQPWVILAIPSHDEESIYLAINGWKYQAVINEFYNQALRLPLKHGDLTAELDGKKIKLNAKTLEWVKAQLIAILNDYELKW